MLRLLIMMGGQSPGFRASFAHGRFAMTARHLITFLAVLLLTSPASLLADDRPVVRIGIVVDGISPMGHGLQSSRLRNLAESIESETRLLTERRFDVRFPADKVVSADWDLARMNTLIDGLLSDPQVDIVLALGVYTSNIVSTRGPLPKPAIATLVVDRHAQGIAFEPGPNATLVSGVPNLTYVTSQDSLSAESTILRDLRKFLELVPFRRLCVLSDAMVAEAIPEVRDNVLEQGRSLGLDLTMITVVDDAEDALARIPESTQAVYITPLFRLPGEQFVRLIDGLNDRGIPSFSLLGRTEVEAGAMAGLRAKTGFDKLARRVALNIQRILNGDEPGQVPVVLPVQGGLSINMHTVRKLGVQLRWRTRIEADLIDDEIDVTPGRELTFFDVTTEAVAANLSLRSARFNVAAAEAAVGQAKARYLPQVEGRLEAVVVDEKTAESSFGSQPERTFSGQIAASQVLFSDPLVAEIQISQFEEAARDQERRSQRLDVALDAARAFLDVLRAQTAARVERQNLDLTEDHLELATRRRAIGASGPAEVFRWESQLAAARIAVIAAQNRVSVARIELNRVLNRPLEEIATLVSPLLDDERLVTCCDRLDPFVEGPDNFAVFRDFSVEEGLSNSPELQALDQAIAARRRVRVAARRSYWAPQVLLRGAAGRRFWRDGAGVNPPGFTIPTTPPTVVDVGASQPRDYWNIGVFLALPLYQGGGRPADVRRATEELSVLRADRATLAQNISTRIRSVLYSAGTTFPAIELSYEAAAASRKNLELVTDSYARGAVSIITLLDAQNAALIAELAASNAEYDFLLDLMEVQRATGTYDFFDSAEGMQNWYARLQEFFDQRGAKVRPAREGAR
ncbi:TolC family protein [bacterium]|nr:TolC family protein [bacterium]